MLPGSAFAGVPRAGEYLLALRWCLKCDVGFSQLKACWLCGTPDIYRWGYRNGKWCLAPID